MEQGFNRNALIAELSRASHGKLEEYIPLAKRAVQEQPAFYSHLIAWDKKKGSVRDAKVALPIALFTRADLDDEYVENARAHITMLGPRELLNALRFLLDSRKTLNVKGHTIELKVRTIGQSLLEREKNWPKWERTMLLHRATLKELFSLLHIKPSDPRTIMCLWRSTKVDGKRVPLPYPQGGLFELVAQLKNMTTLEAAGHIIEKKLPFLVVQGAMEEKAKHPDIVFAMLKVMTPTELVTNVKMLNGLGLQTDPAMRAAYEEALGKASTNKQNVLKTTRALENVDDEKLEGSLRDLQAKQLKNIGVEGNWLVLGDRSPSMSLAVEAAKETAAVLTAMVKGKVWLTFFDSTPETIEVTGLPLDIIRKGTRHINTNGGGTSIGCGMQRALDYGLEVDGIAIISDAKENTAPRFVDAYAKYCKKYDKEVPVYLYRCQPSSSGYMDTDLADSMRQSRLDLQEFDLRGKETDYTSLPNLVRTMRTNRYSLYDEIMDTPLLRLPDAYKHKEHTKTAAAAG